MGLKPNVILHIGYPKTGTSTLQQFLHANTALLNEHGVYYAKRDYNNHVGNADDIYQLCRPGLNKDKLKAILDKDVDNSNGKTILYSQELLFYLEPDFYSFFKEYFNNVKVIVYLRRQDKWLESYKKWQIAAGEPLTTNKRKIPYRLANYIKYLKKIESVLGSESIIIKPFEKQQFFENNLCFDFLNTLDIEKKLFGKYTFSEKSINESFEGKALIYKNLLNRYLKNRMYPIKNTANSFGPWKGLHINNVLSKYSSENIDKDFQIISPKEKVEILKDFSSGNKEILKRYLPKSKELFIEDAPNSDDFYKGMDDLSDSDIKELNSYVFNEICDKAMESDREYMLVNVSKILDDMYDMYKHADITVKEKELVKQSGYFDEKFYLRANPNLPKETDVIMHYLCIGYKEGLDPSEKFCTDFYLRTYPDVSKLNMNPLVHYIKIGKSAGYFPTPKDMPKREWEVIDAFHKLV